MPGGRPTKYMPEYCNDAINFFDEKCYDEVVTKTKTALIEKETTKRIPKLLPTLVGFSRKIGVSYSTLTRWCNPKHASYKAEFCDTITRVCKPYQKNFLIQAGLMGFYNPQAFKFVAVNITDMVDRKDVGIEVGQEAQKFANWLNDRELPEGQVKELPESIETPLPKKVESVELGAKPGDSEDKHV